MCVNDRTASLLTGEEPGDLWETDSSRRPRCKDLLRQIYRKDKLTF